SLTSSYAGIFQSRLNLISIEQLFSGIQACFQAIDSHVLRSYCAARKLTPPQQMCVIIQRFLCPTAAGIAFTRHPTTSAKRVIWVEANYGVGTTVVDGSVTPDRWSVAPDSDMILDFQVGTKK